ncbi:MAG: monovalent cation/H(+) antiporter subunit G [Candidatus Marinimicrobia bacterium]|nr:monovalent cation/H(+) antiporter subunit G [Candidatus Neomarinimicrobiota bacterium]
MITLSIIGHIMVAVGSVFLFLGALGIYRLPDIYSRMQAGTKATTLGALSMIIGVGLIQPEFFTKTVIIALFIAISNPISSHALARGSHRAGIKPFSKSGFDAYDTMKEKMEKDL